MMSCELEGEGMLHQERHTLDQEEEERRFSAEVISCDEGDDEVVEIEEDIKMKVQAAGEVSCLSGHPKTGPAWRIPEGCYNLDTPKIDTTAIACRTMLGQALDGIEELTDVKFLLDDGAVVCAHRGMMSARSEVFRTMFTSTMLESSSGTTIQVSGCSLQSFRAFLEFVYLGTVGANMLGADGRDLYELADAYDIDALKIFLLECIDVTCIGEATWYGCEVSGLGGEGGRKEPGEVLDACLKRNGFLTYMSDALLASFPFDIIKELVLGLQVTRCIYPWTLVDFLILERWAKGNKDFEKDVMELIQATVDFRSMSLHDITTIVLSSGLVSPTHLQNILHQRELWSAGAFQLNANILSCEGGPEGPQQSVQPVALTVVPDFGEVAVLCADGTVVVYTTDGAFVRDFSTEAVSGPLSIAANTLGGVFLAFARDNAGWVQMFTREGVFVDTLEYTFPRSFCMCASPDGGLIVCDGGVAGKHGADHTRLTVFSQDGMRVVSQFQCEGRANVGDATAGHGKKMHREATPKFVRVAHNGDVIVLASGHSKPCEVKVFTSKGVFLNDVGPFDIDEGVHPTSMCISPHGHIVVSMDDATVRVFSPRWGEPSSRVDLSTLTQRYAQQSVIFPTSAADCLTWTPPKRQIAMTVEAVDNKGSLVVLVKGGKWLFSVNDGEVVILERSSPPGSPTINRAIDEPTL